MRLLHSLLIVEFTPSAYHVLNQFGALGQYAEQNDRMCAEQVPLPRRSPAENLCSLPLSWIHSSCLSSQYKFTSQGWDSPQDSSQLSVTCSRHSLGICHQTLGVRGRVPQNGQAELSMSYQIHFIDETKTPREASLPKDRQLVTGLELSGNHQAMEVLGPSRSAVLTLKWGSTVKCIQCCSLK